MRDKIKNMQLARAFQKFNGELDKIIPKIKSKYRSSDYIDRWYKRGLEPENYLYDFIWDYAKKYGREATDKEYEELSSPFTSRIYIIENYVVEVYCGQGCHVSVDRIDRARTSIQRIRKKMGNY